MKIRQAHAHEDAKVRALITRIFPKSKIIIRAQDYVYLAQNGKTCLGFIHIRITRKIIIIQGIGVLPPYRKQGIASKLLEFIKRKFPDSQVRLKVKSTNPATHVYFRAGMMPVKTNGKIHVVAYKKNN